MTKSNLPKWLIAVLSVGIVLCSLFSGIFKLPAIIMFSVLCVAYPSPLLCIIPFISLALSVLYGYSIGLLPQAVTLGISSLSYVLPSVLIALSYFLKYSKFLTVMNGTFGIFVYNIPTAITHFLLNYGTFSKELLNSAVDSIISDTTNEMLAQVSAFDPDGEILKASVQSIEQTMYLMKPLLPAMLIVFSFFFAYIAVCAVNVILKSRKIIEKRNYILMPPWQLGIIFFICIFLNTFVNYFSFLFVITTSVQIILIPVYIIVAFSLVYKALLKAIGNKTVSSIIVISCIFVVFNPIIYNLLYLIGCSYSIIDGIKSKYGNSKGGTL